jgi:hypothetical protein
MTIQRTLSTSPIEFDDDNVTRQLSNDGVQAEEAALAARSLMEQREEIAAERRLRGARQVSRWSEAASTPLLTGRARFIALLEEARRFEIKATLTGRCSRPHDSDVDPVLVARDISATYDKLIREAKRMFDDKKNRGMGELALREVCAQAGTSFAALYPWSDGITCRDIPQDHPAFFALARRNGVSVGESGLTTISTFAAALAVSQMKLQSSLTLKDQRMQEYSSAAVASHSKTSSMVSRPQPPRSVCSSPITP